MSDLVRVDAAGVLFPSGDEPPCDVLFDGRRIVSFSAARGVPERGGVRCAWPPALLPYLKGRSDVTVAESTSRSVRFAGEVRFDDTDQRTSVVNGAGAPLAVTKWGWLGQAFSDSHDAGELVELTARLLRDLNDAVGVPAYAAYGTLLGAVRSGKVIGHDFDTDVSYLSRHSHPADMALESFRMQRILRERGWIIERSRHAKLVVRQLRNIDIFVSYFIGDCYELDMWVEGPLRRDQILPLGTVTMEGHELPAPADPDAVLTLNFGPNWRTPDPTFKYDSTAPRLQRARGWFDTQSDSMGWRTFWRTRPEPTADEPSPFARWVLDRVDHAHPIVDIGCGIGTDALHFASLGIPTIGYDFANQVLDRGRKAAARLTANRPQFVWLQLGDTRATLGTGAKLAGDPAPKTVYARLILDALPDGPYQNFWRLVRMAMARGGTTCLEFRAEPGLPLSGSRPGLWKRVPKLDTIRWRIGKAGGAVVEEERVEAADSPSGVALQRVVATWPTG